MKRSCIIWTKRDVTMELTSRGSDVSSRARGSLYGGAGRESFPAAAALGAGITRKQPPLVYRADRSGQKERRWTRGCSLQRWRGVHWIRVPVWSSLRRSSSPWDGEGAGTAGGGAHREFGRRWEAPVRQETIGRVGRCGRRRIVRECRERRAQLFPSAL